MSKNVVEQAIENVRVKSKGEVATFEHVVTINFHPDRLTPDQKPLLSSIAEDGYLKSQFETGTSNGGFTAYHGGDRWVWEQRVFDGAYDSAPDNLRPKYGALNYKNYEMGASPRFGSSYFQLKPHVLERTTFCYPDSYFEPEDFAVSNRLSALIDMAMSSNADMLDDYIEAHIHGVISLSEDVECLVLDPIYRGTSVEKSALELGVPINWHKGFELSVEQMSLFPDYRGQEYINLARKLAEDGKVNARLLGLAVTEHGYDEQDIKKIWHYLARFGYLSARA